MRVCYFGTYRAGYSRNQNMLASLKLAGIEVITCQVPLWQGVDDRVAATTGGWLRPRFWWRVVRVYWQLLRQFFSTPKFDVLMVGYPGQFDVFLARLLAWWVRKPLVWDVFMSIALIAEERNLQQRNWAGALMVNGLRAIEWFTLRTPDKLIMDTPQYRDWLCARYGLKPAHFWLIPTGANDLRFKLPDTPPAPTQAEQVRVLYYGTYIPNHAVLTIVQAAAALREHESIHFVLVGTGPDRPAAEALAAAENLRQVEFVDWLPPEELVKEIQQADICLGAFGSTPQSLMTVQNKIFEGLALGRAVITGDSGAVREAFVVGEMLWVCERLNPTALAEAILHLSHNPALRTRLGEQGRAAYYAEYSLARNGERMAKYLQSLVGQSA